MIVLADNDLILKLAQCDLLGDLETILTIPISEIYVTAAARFQILKKTKDKGIAYCGSEEIYDRLSLFLAKTTIIPAVQNTQLLGQLSQFKDINGGEQLLFAVLLEIEHALLLTGDKKALNAVITHQAQLSSLFHGLTHKVIVFESILLLALNVLGFEALKQKLLNNPAPDGVLKLIVRPTMNEADLIECLCSYCKEIAIFLSHHHLLP